MANRLAQPAPTREPSTTSQGADKKGVRPRRGVRRIIAVPIRILTRSVLQIVAYDVLTLAAAMAFYTGLALAPLLILMLWAASFLGATLQENLVDEVVALIGPHGGAVVRNLIDEASKDSEGHRTAGVIGSAVLLFSATGVFAQLQSSLNLIFGVHADASRALWQWLRKRLLSFGMLLTLGFLLLVSLVLSAAVSMIARQLGNGWIETAFNLLAPFLVYVAVFGAIFMMLPDVQLSKRDVLGGAALTAGMFTLGKWAIGLYLGMSTVGSAYGTAGSLVVFLSWTYYSCVIVFVGAVLTHQIAAERHGGVLRAEEHAESNDEVAKAREKESVAAKVVPPPPS